VKLLREVAALLSRLKRDPQPRVRLKVTDGLREEVANIISESIQRALIPKLEEILSRYSYEEFKKRVENGFNILEDIFLNHPDWIPYLRRAKRLARYIHWDTDSFTNQVVEILIEAGWPLDEKDIEWIRRQIDEIGDYLASS